MDPAPDPRPPDRVGPLKQAGAAAVAALLGAAVGGAIALRLPDLGFKWTGFVMLPFFVLLENSLTPFLPLFGGDRNRARLTLAGSFVAGFYAAWLGFSKH